MNPTIGIAGCCARAGIDQTAAPAQTRNELPPSHPRPLGVSLLEAYRGPRGGTRASIAPTPAVAPADLSVPEYVSADLSTPSLADLRRSEGIDGPVIVLTIG